MRWIPVLVTAASAAGWVCGAGARGQLPSPQAVVDELLAADRAFSQAAARKTVVDALSSMFANDIVMPLPGGRFARGIAEATAAIRSNPENTTARAEWVPVRGGVSADGHHGFTFGFMTVHRADESTGAAKYVAYWVKGRDGWRVAAYKRGRAPGPPPSTAPRPPSLPERIVPVTTDTAVLAGYRKSLEAAERAFSDEAQRIGIGPAFAAFGSEDAVNLGGPGDADFVTGAAVIGRLVAQGAPAGGSSVSWGAEWSMVSSSGDLGVTFGLIRPNAPPPDPENRQDAAFFTIWRRPTAADPWRYIAE